MVVRLESLYKDSIFIYEYMTADLSAQFINHVKSVLRDAEMNTSLISSDIINIEGMTGTKTRHFYNNLLRMPDARYLEIGSWKGSSVCSAMYKNNATVICIDNWSTFGGPKKEFMANLNKYKGNNNVTFIEQDCFKVDISALPKFNIYMFDGEHTYDEQYNALTYYYNCLDDIFIFVVDDWNYGRVRQGTRDAISKLNLKNLYEKEIFTEYNGVKDGWWNGMAVYVLQK
jgi:hypothetical protein